VRDLEWTLARRDWELRVGSSGTGRSVLIPVYHRIDQAGLDTQYVSGDTLWKLEVIRHVGHGESLVALAAIFYRPALC